MKTHLPYNLLAKIKVIATDVDGTLTVDRESYLIHRDTIDAIRELEKNNIKIILVSGNTMPVLFGLSRYIGTSGPVVGENGCLVGYKGEIIPVCSKSTKELVGLILEEFGEELTSSWQNKYREYDYAFRPKIKSLEAHRELTRRIKKLLEKKRITWAKVISSGFAIHLTPADAGKDKGLVKALEIINAKREEVVGIGDGANDVEMYNAVGLRVAVANADELLKKHADIVLDEPSGRGFARLARLILEAKKKNIDDEYSDSTEPIRL